MMNFDYLFDSIFDTFNDYPKGYTTVYTTTETKDVINATVDSPLAFNLITDSDKECTLELGMAGVKKENLEITKKGRTFTILVKGNKKKDNDKKVVMLKKGLKVPCDEDVESLFTVPEKFDTEKATFKYEDGLLTISVPLKEVEKPQMIKF